MFRGWSWTPKYQSLLLTPHTPQSSGKAPCGLSILMSNGGAWCIPAEVSSSRHGAHWVFGQVLKHPPVKALTTSSDLWHIGFSIWSVQYSYCYSTMTLCHYIMLVCCLSHPKDTEVKLTYLGPDGVSTRSWITLLNGWNQTIIDYWNFHNMSFFFRWMKHKSWFCTDGKIMFCHQAVRFGESGITTVSLGRAKESNRTLAARRHGGKPALVGLQWPGWNGTLTNYGTLEQQFAW